MRWLTRRKNRGREFGGREFRAIHDSRAACAGFRFGDRHPRSGAGCALGNGRVVCENQGRMENGGMENGVRRMGSFMVSATCGPWLCGAGKKRCQDPFVGERKGVRTPFLVAPPSFSAAGRSGVACSPTP